MLLVPFEAVRHHLSCDSFLRPSWKPTQICLSVFMQLAIFPYLEIHSFMTRDAFVLQSLMTTGSYSAFRPVLWYQLRIWWPIANVMHTLEAFFCLEEQTALWHKYLAVKQPIDLCERNFLIAISWLLSSDTDWFKLNGLHSKSAPGILQNKPCVVDATAAGAQFITCGPTVCSLILLAVPSWSHSGRNTVRSHLMPCTG